MKLVINMNSNKCRIYHYDNHPIRLTLLKEISHPENKLKSGELTSDRPGHYKAGKSARGAYSPHMEAKENEIDAFSREVARELNQERVSHDYDELILIAPPHMIGLLYQHLNKNVKDLIVNSIKKDLLRATDKELLNFLESHAKYHDQA